MDVENQQNMFSICEVFLLYIGVAQTLKNFPIRLGL